MPLLELSFAGGETSLSVRRFSVYEGISTLFSVAVWACSENPAVNLEAIVGQPAALRVVSGWTFVRSGGLRSWGGVISTIEQVQAVVPGPGAKELSTYYMRIVPALWLLTQRRNYRIFQHLPIPDIVDRVLAEWKIEPTWQIDRGTYPKLEYKVQYGETDYSFISRLLEEAGISFRFVDTEGGESTLLLVDKPHAVETRPGGPIPFVDNPNQESEQEFVTHVRLSHEVRPGAHLIRDYDFRNPNFPLYGDAPKAKDPESRYEQYHYRPGGFLVETGKGGNTPVADDKGIARYDQPFGKNLAGRMLAGQRMGRRAVAFDTNVMDLHPGQIFQIDHHPHGDLAESSKLLVTEFSLEGSPEGEWSLSGRAVFADSPYLPPQRTPKPIVDGVQSATVVGPNGQEIHTDEFGRVRVQFPWDREGKMDDKSSCWIRVNQGWAGTGYGMIVLPRIGQEVLVGFLEGDPDQPLIVGRVFNATQRVPYRLPEHKTRSTWKSDSSLGSNGFNEIMFEDMKGKELIYVQAEKNLRKLVKHDETITIGRNRSKLVKANETETTGLNRVEVTGANRTEITGANRTTVVGANNQTLIKGDELLRVDGKLAVYIGQNHEIVVKQVKRERIEKDSHLTVKGKRNQKIFGSQSLTVDKNQDESVGQNHALEAAKDIHFKAGSALIIEAVQDLTLKGPGGFIRIDASGVTIKGTLVRINSGGSPGKGAGSNPELPEDAKEAEFELPSPPVMDDVNITGIGQ
jgi:type VI secretion system secreted protein VgrG